MPKFGMYTCAECNGDDGAGYCTGQCSRCGWNPRVMDRRLSKYSEAEVQKMKSAKFICTSEKKKGA